MFDKHPVAMWSSILLTLVTMAAGVASTWYYIMAERDAGMERSARLAEIRQEQELIRRELALQTQELETIRSTQGDILGTMDRRFDKVEDGHDRIVREFTDGLRSMAVEVGRVSERQNQEVHP